MAPSPSCLQFFKTGIPSFFVGVAAAFFTAFACCDPRAIVPLRAVGFLIVVVFFTAGAAAFFAAGLAAPPKKLNPAGLEAGAGTGAAAFFGAGLSAPPKKLNPAVFAGAGVGTGLGVERAFFGTDFVTGLGDTLGFLAAATSGLVVSAFLGFAPKLKNGFCP